MGRIWLLSGAVLGFLFVTLGAFGAHALEKWLSLHQMEIISTANQYLGYHALALLILGLWSEKHGKKSQLTGLAFLAGIILFSGSLYVYILADLRWAAMITPLGGLSFLIGWGSFAYGVWGNKGKTI